MNIYEQQDKVREDEILKLRLEQFHNRWAPVDLKEASRFHSEFYSLVMQIHRAAQQPLISQWTAILATMPMMSILPKKD
jgi:hypothetical protein